MSRSIRGYHQRRKLKKDGTEDLRCTSQIHLALFTTYEEEKAFLLKKRLITRGDSGYLPTLEEIESEKQAIREENEERDRLANWTEEKKVGTHNLQVRFYRLDTTGHGGRHGKVI